MNKHPLQLLVVAAGHVSFCLRTTSLRQKRKRTRSRSRGTPQQVLLQLIHILPTCSSQQNTVWTAQELLLAATQALSVIPSLSTSGQGARNSALSASRLYALGDVELVLEEPQLPPSLLPGTSSPALRHACVSTRSPQHKHEIASKKCCLGNCTRIQPTLHSSNACL